MEGLKTYPSIGTRKFSLTDVVVSLLILVTCYLGWKVYDLNKKIEMLTTGEIKIEQFLNLATQNQFSAFLEQVTNNQPK